MAVVAKVAGEFTKYYQTWSRFEVELVGSSHGLNQEKLMDNVLSVIHLIITFWAPPRCIIVFQALWEEQKI